MIKKLKKLIFCDLFEMHEFNNIEVLKYFDEDTHTEKNSLWGICKNCNNLFKFNENIED